MVRSGDRGGGRPVAGIVSAMQEAIMMVLGAAGWSAGVAVLVLMAALPLLEAIGAAGKGSGR